MAWIFLDAAAQSTCASPITNVQLTVVLASSASFGAPTGGDKVPLIILDAGNGAWNANNPLATPYEFVDETTNVPGTNTITITRAQGGTTAKAFSAGAIIAAVPQSRMFAAGGTGAFPRIDGPNQTPNLGVGPVKLAPEIVTTAGQVNVSFTSIPSGYRHLVIRYVARDNGAGTTVAGLNIQVNADVGAAYYAEALSNTQLSATAEANIQGLATTSGLAGLIVLGGQGAGRAAYGTVEFPCYNTTAFYKTWQYRAFCPTDNTNATGTWRNDFGGGLYASLSAINRVDFLATFAVGCVFTLYGEA